LYSSIYIRKHIQIEEVGLETTNPTLISCTSRFRLKSQVMDTKKCHS